MKIFRWKGLIGFVVVILLIGGGSYFFAAPLAKTALESAGKSALEVPVTIDNVGLSLDPIGFKVEGVQIPDKEDFNKNSVIVAQAIADIELWKLLRGKVQINDLSVTGIQFDQVRASPWEPIQKDEPKAESESKQEESVAEEKEPSRTDQLLADAKSSIPSADELLEREKQNLLTPQLSEQVKEKNDANSKAIQDNLKEIPSKKELDGYKKEIQQLLSDDIKSLNDFNRRKKRLEQIQKELKADAKAVQDTAKSVDKGQKDLRTGISELTQAPKEDLQSLKDRYQFNETGAQNLGELVFGNEVREWTDKALVWYDRIKPFLNSKDEKEAEPDRDGGRFVAFPTDRPDPDFWLKNSLMTATLETGFLEIQVQDVASDFNEIGKPASLLVTSESISGSGPFKLEGSVGLGDEKFDITWDRLAVKNERIIKSSELEIDLKKATGFMTGVATVVDGKIDLDIKTDFKNSRFDASGNGLMNRELAKAMEGITEFDLEILGDGPVRDMEIEVKSNIERQVSSAFNDRLKEEQDQLIKDVEKRLQAELEKELGPLKAELTKLDNQKAELAGKKKEIETMAKAKLKDWEAQQKAKLDAEKKKAEAEAKKKAEEARMKLEKEKKKAEEEAKKKAQEELKKGLESLF